MLNIYFLDAIRDKTGIADLTCPMCHNSPAEVSVIGDEMQMTCCEVRFEPVLVIESESQASIRFLLKAGDIGQDVFNAFVAHSIRLSACPKCGNVLGFTKDASDTEKPYCCDVFFPPVYVQDEDRGKKLFRFHPKPLDATFVDADELRSLSLASYKQQVADFETRFVVSNGESFADASVADENSPSTVPPSEPPIKGLDEEGQRVSPSTAPSSEPPTLENNPPTSKIDAVVSEAAEPCVEPSEADIESMSDKEIAAFFFETYLHSQREDYELCDSIYGWYTLFVDDLDREAFTKQTLYKLLREHFETAEYKRKRVGTKNPYVFMHIRCIPPERAWSKQTGSTKKGSRFSVEV